MTIRPPVAGPRVRQSPREEVEGPRGEQAVDVPPGSATVAATGVTMDGFEGSRGAEASRSPRRAESRPAPAGAGAEGLKVRAATLRAEALSLAEGLAAAGFTPEAIARDGDALRATRAELSAVRSELVALRRQHQRAGVVGTPLGGAGKPLGLALETLRGLPSGPARRVEGLRLGASLLPAAPDGTPLPARFSPASATTGPLLAQVMPQAGVASDMKRELGGTSLPEGETAGLDRLQQLLALSGAQ